MTDPLAFESVTPAGAAQAWVDAWSTGWAKHDTEAIAQRYSRDCVFVSHPFRTVGRGRDAASIWVRDTFAQERSVRFVFGAPIVAPDGRAAVEYRAVITDLDGAEHTLAGTTVLRFDRTGRVLEHRDYWAIADGDHGLGTPIDPSREAMR